MAGAVGMVEPSHRLYTALPGAEHDPLEPLFRVAEGVLAAVESGDGGVRGGLGDKARVGLGILPSRLCSAIYRGRKIPNGK